MDDTFEDVINENISIEKEDIPFKIHQLKLTHFYWNSGDIGVGMPVSTSIELISNYNFETQSLEWEKIISHTYLSFEDYKNKTTDSYRELIINDDIIFELESVDLREFKNNYFTDKNPERFTHWEIEYNNYFKIVGTYDQELDVLKNISELLNFKAIMQEEVKKIEDKILMEE